MLGGKPHQTVKNHVGPNIGGRTKGAYAAGSSALDGSPDGGWDFSDEPPPERAAPSPSVC